MKFMWNNIKTNFGSKGGIENIIVMDSIVMIIGTSFFSKPFKILILHQNFLPSHTCFLGKKWSCNSIRGDFIFDTIVVKVALSSKLQCKIT
jgi:hypothetical protein